MNHHQLLDEYAKIDPDVDLWRRVPDVTEEEDLRLDEVACEEMSRRFRRTAEALGFQAAVIHADQSDRGDVDYHRFVELRIGASPQRVYVDWTARQFHNCDPPLDLPCPLTWTGSPFDHPVGFRRVRLVEVRYAVDDLQAVEPDALAPADGITVTVADELDSQGFNRVEVEGPSPEAVIAYVSAPENWGTDDQAWLDTWVVERVREVGR